jgi:hypothetical protein
MLALTVILLRNITAGQDGNVKLWQYFTVLSNGPVANCTSKNYFHF